MSYRTKVKSDTNGTLVDLPLDAETLGGENLATVKRYTPHYPTAISGTSAVDTSPYYCSRWDATDSSITTLYDGLTIIIRVPVAGNGTYGVGLSINSGDYHPVVYNISTTVGTRYGVNSTIMAVYNSTQSASLYLNSASATSITGVWQVYDYDSDTDTTYRLRNSSAIYINKTGQATNRRTLLFEVDGGLSGVNTTIVTGSSKTPIAFKYIPYGQIRYYSTSGSIANDGTFASGGLWEQYALDIRYSFNTGSTLIDGNPVYIRMVVNNDGTLSQDATTAGANPIVQALPSSADNKVYVYLGRAGGTSTLELETWHPIYEYKDGAIRLWTNAVASGGGSATDVQVNGTSIVSNGVANLVTNTAYNSSNNKLATMSDIPTNTNQLTNGAGYITSSDLPTNHVTTDTAQTISGVKTFTDKIVISDGTNGADIKMDNSQRIAFYFGNNPKVKMGQLDTLFANRVTPDSSNTYDIGRDTVYWRDLYLAGSLKDGTNSISIANIADKSSVQTAREIAQGKTSSYVINAQSEITGTKDGNDEYSGVTAITGVTIADLKVGDVILIKALEVPDYWVSAVTTTNSVVTSVALNKMETTKVSVPSTYLKSASSSGNTLTLTKQDNTTTTFTPTFTEQYTGTVTSVRVQAGTGLSSSTSTAQSSTLDTTISIDSGYKLPTTSEWSGKQDSLTTTSVSDGTIDKVIGFDSNGNIVKATQSSGGATITFVDWS